MEFVNEDNALNLLKQFGVAPVEESENIVRLRMDDGEDVVHLHLCCEGADVEPRDGARTVDVPREQLAPSVDDIVHQLHLSQVLLIPVGKWRKVFDCVAFSLAQNEEWTEIDAAATIQLNQRDPLLFEPADYNTLCELLKALMENAEDEDQGVTVTTTASPVLIEVIPQGALRVSLGIPALADEILEAIEAGT